MNFKPYGDKLLVKKIEEEKTTKSGIIIPDIVKQKTCEGIVVAVGKGEFYNGEFIEPEIKVNNRVVFSKNAGQEISVDNEKYTLLYLNDIFGVLG